jgi:hypothetical protein
VVECLSSNWEALSPNPKTAKQSKAKQTSQIKKKNKKNKKGQVLYQLRWFLVCLIKNFKIIIFLFISFTCLLKIFKGYFSLLD